MAGWGFFKEGTQAATGANSIGSDAAYKDGYQPSPAGQGFGQAMKEKRNVIATSKGWVRREIRGSRTIDEVLVAAGQKQEIAGLDTLGFPDITQMYVKLNANGVISANVATANLYVVFNSAVKIKASANLMYIRLANTAGGNSGNAHIISSNTVASTVAGSNNQLIFNLPPLMGGTGSAKGTYRINAQSIGVTGSPVYNPELSGQVGTANLVITGSVSNNLLNFAGDVITTFQVSPKGV